MLTRGLAPAAFICNPLTVNRPMSEHTFFHDELRPDELRSTRRSFFKIAGLGGVALAAAGCDSDGDDDDDFIALDFSNDIGVLNYAYALEQLEAAFYEQVVDNLYDGINDDETRIMNDLAAHEGIHRDFFNTAISMNGGTPIPGLTPNFDAVDFDSRASVLATALRFEDLGVGAYNGAAQYLSETEDGVGYLVLAGKIVSVEARHASVIAGLITRNTIAASGVIDAMGLDRALAPATVLGMAGDFIEEDIRAIRVPVLS